MDQVIVIATHISGVQFLENLLESFRGYNKYPILLAVSDSQIENEHVFLNIKNNFKELPIEIIFEEKNLFEYTGIYSAYYKTKYNEFLLLGHSCEIVNPKIFDLAFETHKGISCAGCLAYCDWGICFNGNLTNEERTTILFQYISPEDNQKIINKGQNVYCVSYLGKYRREILDKMDLSFYNTASNIIDAHLKLEIAFTSDYFALDSLWEQIFPFLFQDGINIFEKKFGKYRKKYQNEYIIKYKSHWSLEMLLDHAKAIENNQIW